MTSLKMNNVNKTYDNGVQVVFDFNLSVDDKEFIVLVGPSGCGKSTTLRMIAGLEEVTSGDIYIGDERMNNVAPKNREIAMVFQSYALYPHMSVYDNIAFSLKIANLPKDEIENRVVNAAKILGLEEYLRSKPRVLSGGQKQRVSLGRAIVRDAKLFLMDEPLSSLDAKLRLQMRTEIIKLHKKLGTTTIYVTHDQTEAMTMATRIVVMKEGHIQQVGTPREVYNNPANVFVGGFIGAPAMNFIKGTVNKGVFTAENFVFSLSTDQIKKLSNYQDKKVLLGIRPEHIHFEKEKLIKHLDNKYQCRVVVSELLGDEVVIYSQLANQDVVARVSAAKDITVDDMIDLVIEREKVHFFDDETGLAIK